MPGEVHTFNLEPLIKSAQQHGEDSDPDHEVGDLQDYLRAMWSILTPQQQEQFFKLDAVIDTYYGATGEDGAHLSELVMSRPARRRPKP